MPIPSTDGLGTTKSPLTGDAALRVMARHQQRRRQRIPTVTVIAASSEAAATLVRQFAELEGRPVGESSSLAETDAVECWLTARDPGHLASAAYQWLAKLAQCDANLVSAAMPERSVQEQSLFLDRVLGTKCVSPIAAVSRAVVEHLWQFSSIMPGVGRRLLDACDGDFSRIAAGMLALVGQDQAPVLYTACADETAALHTIVANAATIAAAVSQLPIVVSATRQAVHEYLAATPECRAVALVREGVVWLAERAQAPAAPVRLTANVRDEVPEPADRNSGPTPSIAVVGPSAADDAARSEAERYLFERLQAHPLTTGLFDLNGSLESAGGRKLEVDLLARSVRVAIEIDGYYHFTDFDAYRRDREKDRLLQHAGYFVVRCLADDVASRLEEILEMIIAAVRRP